MAISKSSNVLVFLEAAKKEDLIMKMFQQNVANGKQYAYTPPSKDGKMWVTWFLADLEADLFIDMENKIKEVLDDNLSVRS